MLKKSVVITLMAFVCACASSGFAMDLGASVVVKSQVAGQKIYKELLERINSDKTKTFVEHMVSWEKIHESMWEPLASEGFAENKITPADLDFVVAKYSAKPDDPSSKDLFRIFIVERLEEGGAKAKQAIDLLQKPEIKVAFGSALMPSSLREERRSVLISCLENNYMGAFKTILNAWPPKSYSLIGTVNIEEVTKIVDLESSGMVLNSYKDKSDNYTIVQWLLRNLENAQNSWGYYDNKAVYQEAAQQVLLYLQQRMLALRANGDILSLAALLKRNDKLPVEINFEELVGKVTNITGLKWENIPDFQQAEIKKLLPENLAESLKINLK